MFCQKPKLREAIWLFIGLWNWSEIALWLSCCLHRLLTIVSLAADLVHQDCIISGRMAKVHSLSTKTVWSIWGLFSFWSSTPLPASPLHRITEADLFWIFFHWIGCLLDSCLPAASGSPGWCNFFSKSLLELFLKHCLLRVTRQITQVLCFQQVKSYREETVIMTNTKTFFLFFYKYKDYWPFLNTIKKIGVIINYFWHVLFNSLFPRTCM